MTTSLTLPNQDEDVLAFENRVLAGEQHWLIIPTRHIRDVEQLENDDLDICES